MEEKIYTIPINEAFDVDCECPICEFLKKEELSRVEYTLGASMMEPEDRIRSNQNGYCQRHIKMMCDHGNKLSHALILETRLDYILKLIEEMNESIDKLKNPGLFSAKKSRDIYALPEINELARTSDSCVICQELDRIMEGFISNLFYMYKNDSEFVEKMFASKGFCLIHFEMLVNNCSKYLSFEQAKTFLSRLCKLERENLKRVIDDVEWFTKKFDYRYKDAEWKNSKDAVQRGSLKISGFVE